MKTDNQQKKALQWINNDKGGDDPAELLKRLIDEIEIHQGESAVASILATCLLRTFGKSPKRRWRFKSVYGEITVTEDAPLSTRLH